MSERGSLSPRVMREVAETDWTDVASVARAEQHAKQLFELLVAPLREKNEPDADSRAREWTIGALTSAFPRDKRADIRPKMRELVERVIEQMCHEALVSRETVVEQARMQRATTNGKARARKGWTR